MSAKPQSWVWVLQHSACETTGAIGEAVESAGIEVRPVRTFAGEPVPARMEEAAGLIVMGGPMGVCGDTRFPFLKQETRLMEQALKERRPILGVCLGSQLLAAALGARVTPAKQKEIGWRAVTLTDEAQRDALWKGVEPAWMGFHWHGDVFDLPKGACGLAASLLTPHQAYRYGDNAYGFLFHIEVTEEIVRGMVETFAAELRQEGIREAEILEGIPIHLPRLQQMGRLVFRRWAALLSEKGEGGSADAGGQAASCRGYLPLRK